MKMSVARQMYEHELNEAALSCCCTSSFMVATVTVSEVAALKRGLPEICPNECKDYVDLSRIV